jgi:hypothetical protein
MIQAKKYIFLMPVIYQHTDVSKSTSLCVIWGLHSGVEASGLRDNDAVPLGS